MKTLSKFKNFDLMAPSSVELTFNGQTHFQTYFGAICTIVIYSNVFFLFVYCVFLFDYSSQDVVFTSSEIFPYSSPGDGISMVRKDG